MAGRVTGRRAALVPASISPERRRRRCAAYCAPWIDVDARALRRRRPACSTSTRCAAALGDDAACVYVENPGYLGAIEARGGGRSRPAHARGRVRSSSASTRSRSACSRRRRATAPTSSAASCSRSASTCTSAAASRASSRRRDEERWVRRVPDLPDRHDADRRRRASTASARSPGSGRRTCSAGDAQGLRRHDAGPVGDRGGRRTCRCSARTGIAELGEGLMQRARYAAAAARGASPGVERAGARRPRLQGARRRRSTGTGKTVAEINAAAARARHLRRPRHLPRVPGARAERRSTASPRCTRRPTSTGSSTTLAEVLRMSENGRTSSVPSTRRAGTSRSCSSSRAPASGASCCRSSRAATWPRRRRPRRRLPAELRRTDPPALPGALAARRCCGTSCASRRRRSARRRRHPPRPGTCTMKYSPQVNEELVRSPKVADLHP